jgi:hypothetical protein
MPATVDDVRTWLLERGDIVEASHFDKPDFRRKGKIVASVDVAARTVTVKLFDLDEQAALFAQDPETFTGPGGWAKHGWTTIALDRVDAAQLRELLDAACAPPPKKQRG